jgi:hypothetical protein
MVIRKEDLKKGWYKGIGRNSNVAYWTGRTFLTIGKTYDSYLVKNEGLFEEGGCFEPREKISECRISGDGRDDEKDISQRC